MEWTKHEKRLIHEVMEMAYEQGIEEGKRRAIETMKERRDLPYDAFGDFSHHPQPNSFVADEWYRENFKNE